MDRSILTSLAAFPDNPVLGREQVGALRGLESAAGVRMVSLGCRA